jgi:hypothetical protein
MLIKEVIHQEEITIVNLFAHNICAPNFIKHMLLDLNLQIDHNTVVMEDFNNPLSPIDKSSR